MTTNDPNTCPSDCDNKECNALLSSKEIDESSGSTQKLKVFNSLTGFTRVIGALFMILVVAWIGQYRGGFGWYTNTPRKFNWHPMLMAFGMVFLYSNGMLIYRTQRNMGMPRLTAIHGGIMIFSVFCTIVGLVIGFQNHDEAGGGSMPNMYTLHSWVGLISVLLFFSQCAAGFVSFVYPGIQPHSQATYKEWHVYLGKAGFVGAVVACLLGFNEKSIFAVHSSIDHQAENTMIWIIYLSLIAFGGLSLYLVSQNRFKRLARPGDKDPLTKEAIFGNLCSGNEQICCLPCTPNDCARSVQIIFSSPQSPALESTDTYLPPILSTPPSDVKNKTTLKVIS